MNIAFCLMKHDYILQNKNVARGGAFCGFARILSGMMGESRDSEMLLPASASGREASGETLHTKRGVNEKGSRLRTLKRSGLQPTEFSWLLLKCLLLG